MSTNIVYGQLPQKHSYTWAEFALNNLKARVEGRKGE